MKINTNISILSVLLCALVLTGCNAFGRSGASGEVNFDKETSYALGLNSALNWKNMGIRPDLKELFRGVSDAYNKDEQKYTIEETNELLNTAYSELQEKIAAANRQAGDEYLEENSQKEGVIITESGLQYELLSEGMGDKPGPEDTVRVHYEGQLVDGTVFDSSYSRGDPMEFPVNAVIPGWSEGLQLMNVGSSYRFVIPSDLGYGPWGAGQSIPPDSVLIFKVDLIDIVKKE